MKILRGIVIVITMVIALNVLTTESSAVTVKTFDEMKSSIETFLNTGKSGNSKISSSDMSNIIIPVANILTAIGVLILVGVTIIMGIKYMFATPEEAAKLKQQLIGLVVSAVVILGATAIWKIVYNLLSQSGL